MRIGNNPYKDQISTKSEFLHQVIIPVYVPNFEGYFKDSFEILKICLQSLFNTTHSKTFITIVNNGSCNEIKIYLDTLLSNNKIHEIIHTNNVGKINAVLKGLVGNTIELVTISDADVMFLPNWQQQTSTIFDKVAKVGVVGIVPQFSMYKTHSSNLIFDNFFNSKLKFFPVENKEAMVAFYDSIGWDRNYNQDYLKYVLCLQIEKELHVLVGSGHFVATYKKSIFDIIKSNNPYKLGGDSEYYLDTIPLKNGYWRVTTSNNFAYHLGNTLEDWMQIPQDDKIMVSFENFPQNFKTIPKPSNFNFFVKNKFFKNLLFKTFFLSYFYKWKGLPKSVSKNY